MTVRAVGPVTGKARSSFLKLIYVGPGTTMLASSHETQAVKRRHGRGDSHCSWAIRRL